MADATASFAVTFDTSGLRSGSQSGMSAIDKLALRIQKASKELNALRGAQGRLAQSAPVKQYLAQQKAIEKTQAAGSAMEKKLAEAQANRAKLAETNESIDIAKQANVAAEDMAALVAESERLGRALKGVDANKLTDSIAKTKAELEALTASQDKLGGDESVKAYKDQEVRAAALQSELASLQTEFDRAGGDAATLGDKFEEPKAGIKGLLDQAKAAGGPIGEFAGKLESLGSMAKVAGPLAIVAAIIAITTAAIKGAIALGKFALASADVARNAGIAKGAAAFGATEGVKDIDAAMATLRGSTAASRTEAQALATELYRAGERGQGLEETALTIQRFGVLGEDAAGAVKGLYDTLRQPLPQLGGVAQNSMVITKDMLPRDVFLELANQLGKDGTKALLQGFTANRDNIKTALSNIGEQRFAGPAMEQMRSLDKLAERWEEAKAGLFQGLKIGVLLGALQKLVNLLDETTESGKAIKVAFTAIGQPLIDAIEAAMPFAEAFFEGMVLGALLFVLAGVKLKNALSDLIPASLTKNIDWINVAFYAGGIAMATMTLAAIALAAAVFLLALPFLTVAATVIGLGLIIVASFDYIMGTMDSVIEYFEDFDLEDTILGITNGIVKGIEDGAAAIYDAFANLAKGGLAKFKEALGIKSPSLAFRLAGREIPRGAALGIDDESDKVEASTASMTSPADMGASGGGSGRSGSGGAPVFNFAAGAIVINGVSGAEEMNEEGFMRRLGLALISAAREGGVSPEPEAE